MVTVGLANPNCLETMSAAVILVVAVFASSTPLTGTASHSAYSTVQGSRLILGNDFLELSFNLSARGNLVSFLNKLTNFDLIPSKASADSLWTGYTTSGSYFTASNMQSFQWSVASNDSSVTAKFSWINYGARQITVNANVTVPNASSEAFWNMNVVNNNSSVALHSMFFPFVYGITYLGSTPLGDILVLPDRNGLMIKNPYLIESTWWGLEIGYPDTASMQAFLLYKEGYGGFYFASLDPKGYAKAFDFQHQNWPKGTSYKAGLRSYVENAVPGASYRQPYPIVTGVFAGAGWQEGISFYRDWALKQWWVQQGSFWTRQDVPNWWRNGVMLWQGTSYTSNSQGQVVLTGITANQLGDMAGQMRSYLPTGDLTYDLWGWNKGGFDSGYPEVFPPRDGSTALKQGTKAAHVDNVHIMVYVNARLVDVNTSTYGKALPYAIEDQDGRPVFEQYNFPTLNATVMDPSTDYWKQTLLNISITLVRDYGIDGIYFDQGIGPAIPSFNPRANHPMGGGTWWISSRIAMYQQIRSQIRLYNPQAIITVENENEMLMPYVDGFNSVDTNTWFVLRDWQSQYGKGTLDAEYIALFPFVYGPYSPVRFGSYDPTPVSWGGQYISTSDWSQAIRVLRGAYPSLSMSQIFPQSSLNQLSMSFQVGLAYARATYLSSWLEGGQFLDESSLGSNVTYGEWGYNRIYNLTGNAVASMTYRSPSGSLAVFSANVGANNDLASIAPDYTRWRFNQTNDYVSLIADHFDLRNVVSATLQNEYNLSLRSRSLEALQVFPLLSACLASCNSYRSIRLVLTGNQQPLEVTVGGFPLTIASNHSRTLYAPWGVMLNISTSRIQALPNDTRDVFQGWQGNGSGSYSGTEASLAVILASNLSFTGAYSVQYAVLIRTNLLEAGSTTPSGSEWYTAGTVSRISATPKTGYSFFHWSTDSPAIKIADASLQATTMTVRGPGNVTAEFTKLNQTSTSTISSSINSTVTGSTQSKESTSTATSTPAPTTIAASSTTSTAESTSTQGGGGIPEFPFQLTVASTFTLIVIVFYLAVRNRQLHSLRNWVSQ